MLDMVLDGFVVGRIVQPTSSVVGAIAVATGAIIVKKCLHRWIGKRGRFFCFAGKDAKG